MAPSAQTITPNLNLALPADDSHNTPWGISDQVLAQAISAADNSIVVGIQQQAWVFAIDTGVANAYVVSFTPKPTITVGSRFYFKATHANTGASTIAINSGSAQPITKNGTTALAGAEIAANQIIQIVFDGTNWQMISQ
jgi:hypothetical protein